MYLKKPAVLILFFFFSFIGISYAGSFRYSIDPNRSSIKCSVNYLVVPKIEGVFDDLSGVIYYDDKNISKSSVLIKVKTESINTGNPTWDKIIRSRKVLNAEQHPNMVFKSSAVIEGNEGLSVDGLLDLNGVAKNMFFSFDVEGPFIKGDLEYIKAKGKWVIDRKDFNIIWHKTLDKGGIIVGNQVTVHWEIFAVRE